MKIDIYYANKENTYLKAEDKLVWCKLISANLAFDRDLYHYKLHYVLQTEGGVISVDDTDIHLYSKNGIEYRKDWNSICDVTHNRIFISKDNDGFETYQVVVFDGVTAVRQSIIPLVATYSYENGGGWKVTWSKQYSQDDCYDDEKKCAKWNRCLVREPDGAEHIVEGLFYGLKLNDEQIKAVSKFEKACDKLSEAGLNIIVGQYGDYALIVPKDKQVVSSYDNPGYKDDHYELVDEDYLYECRPLAHIFKDVKYNEDYSLWYQEDKQ